MNLDIRKAVLNNLINASQHDVLSTINDAITTTEEKVLPGLGVLLEVYWKAASMDDKNRICELIASQLKQ